MNINSVIQISAGDIPSKATHSVQIMKMAEAFSRVIKDHTLVTSGGVFSSRSLSKKNNISEWYGLSEGVRITQIPTHLRNPTTFPENYYGGLPYILLSALYARSQSPDFVYTRTPIIAKSLLALGMPVVWEYHSVDQTKHYKEWVLGHPNLLAFVTLSNISGDLAISKGLPPEKLVIEPSAVDSDRLNNFASKEIVRSKLDLPKDKTIVAYTGQLHDYKGIPTVIKLASRMKDILFLLVGGWEEDVNRVQQICNSQNLTNVLLTGYVNQSQLPEYQLASDILILPTSTKWEESQGTSPLKLFEYMASKRPIVASNLPNIREIITNGCNGLLATPDDVDSFENAIHYIVTDKSAGNLLAEKAFEDVKEFTWDGRAKRILSIASKHI